MTTLFKLENFEPCILFCTRQPFKKGTRRFRAYFRSKNRIYVYKLVYEPHPQLPFGCLLPLPSPQQPPALPSCLSDIAG